ncbi:MAG: phage portal protein family protein [Bacteroidales bacterium]
MVNLVDRFGIPMKSDLQLAESYERLKKMVVELAIQSQALTKKDIAAWRQAWQMAINVDNPRRKALYDIYRDIEIDNHLSGIIDQLSGAILARSFKIVDKRKKKEVPELTELFETEWFKTLVKYILDTRYWGHSLVQFGDLIVTPAGRRFDRVDLIPREHVIPEYGVILRQIWDDISAGIPYRDGKIARWLIEIDYPYPLGLYLKVAPQCISKKNMLAFWDQFGEIFGMPIRIARTSTTDPKERTRLERMLSEMGSAAWGLFPDGTDIDIKESSRGDAYNVYDKRIERANSEMSKAILTVTMTTDDGSSRSQSEVHQDMLQLLIEKEADRVRDTINNKLLPRLVDFGFPIDPNVHAFEWDYAQDYTPEQQLAFENLLLTHFDIDEKYFIDKYNVPIRGRLAQTQLGFFGHAPQGSGASDW